MAEGKRVVRQYPVEFKIDAVELVEKKGYGITEAARSLGISESNIHKWRTTGTSFGRKQYREGRLVIGHKRAQPTADEAELRRLQVEMKP